MTRVNNYVIKVSNENNNIEIDTFSTLKVETITLHSQKVVLIISFEYICNNCPFHNIISIYIYPRTKVVQLYLLSANIIKELEVVALISNLLLVIISFEKLSLVMNFLASKPSYIVSDVSSFYFVHDTMMGVHRPCAENV